MFPKARGEVMATTIISSSLAATANSVSLRKTKPPRSRDCLSRGARQNSQRFSEVHRRDAERFAGLALRDAECGERLSGGGQLLNQLDGDHELLLNRAKQCGALGSHLVPVSAYDFPTLADGDDWADNHGGGS